MSSLDSIQAGLAEVGTGGGFVWVELDHPTRGDFADAAETLGLHALAVEDAVNARDRPKLDVYGDQQFLGLVTLHNQDAAMPLVLGRVMALTGDKFVVTVRQEDGDTLERARRRVEGTPTPSLTPFDVLHAVADTVVDDLVLVSEGIEAAILASADRLFATARSDEAHSLYQVTRQLLALGHAVRPLIAPLQHLSSGAVAGLDVEMSRRFQDVLDHGLVLDREISDHGELVEYLSGSNDSRIGLQQNIDMRRIAAWAAVIAVPTAITGFFGMNVPYPGFGEMSGVVGALALQGVLAVCLIIVFRRRGWL